MDLNVCGRFSTNHFAYIAQLFQLGLVIHNPAAKYITIPNNRVNYK